MVVLTNFLFANTLAPTPAAKGVPLGLSTTPQPQSDDASLRDEKQ